MELRRSTKFHCILRKSTIIKLCLLLLIPFSLLFDYAYSHNPIWWENFYSRGINKKVIEFLSQTVGVFSCSVFELLVLLFTIFLGCYTLYTIYNTIKHYKQFYIVLGRYFLNIAVMFAIILSSFELLWGLNYKRPQFGIGHGLIVGTYTVEELGMLYSYLLKRAGLVREILNKDENGIVEMYGDYENIFARAHFGYNALEGPFPELNGDYGRVKPFGVSEFLNYAFITGMYSPFTGEPNVNIAIPNMYIPSTTCHEMAHQRGYGFEDQCNFIAFITCERHPDPDFQYSGYLLAISYMSNALAAADFELLKSLNDDMPDGVKKDLDFGNAFWDQYRGETQEIADSVNNAFLKSNGVHSGTRSYGKVVDLLLAYYDKYFDNIWSKNT
ncbi:hypothetical protein AN641_00510 [Candidatus Epulonipiscioides gigas]|nr:hypothetical protein AN641_00510 [Epulopiscium sp. SCG-C07WGA-EpuloA2]